MSEAIAVVLREERPGDEPALAAIIADAFRTHPHSNHAEQHIVAALRRADALLLSLVAEAGGQPVGHVAFSSVAIGDGNDGWVALGPLTVTPPWQGRGAGSALVERGLATMRERGVRGCVLLGDPAFYGRFGFRADPALVRPGFAPERFLSRRFSGAPARGVVTYHEAFGARG